MKDEISRNENLISRLREQEKLLVALLEDIESGEADRETVSTRVQGIRYNLGHLDLGSGAPLLHLLAARFIL